MARSLRQNLFIGIVGAVVLTGGLAGYLVYNWAYDEAIEMQDSVLLQIASVARSHDQDVTTATELNGVDADAHTVLVQEGRDANSTQFRSLWSLPSGLQDTAINGIFYRAFLSEASSGPRFAVLQQTSLREEIGSGMALRVIGPMLALIPVMTILIAVVVTQTFKPLVQLSRHVDARNADELNPLPLAHAPSELQPFLISLNRLFERVRELLDRQQKIIADAAHELRTPITALSIQAENLDATVLSDDARSRVEALKSGANRTKHLLEQLLAMARQESGVSLNQKIEIGEVAKKVVINLIEFSNRKDINLGLEQGEPLQILAEKIAIESLLRNIIDNAIKYTPKGGKIDIRLRRENNLAVISVEDTGPGIADDELSSVFDPFVRGGLKEGDGSGLGLSIVRRITDQLSGTVKLSNKTDRSGLTVTVELPIQI
jgi:two-component system OmpR family sensor kinase